MSFARVAVGVALLAGASVGASEAPPPASRSWTFRALLDGRAIGEHRFDVTADGNGRRVDSVARFDVKLMMFTAYRYRHRAVERWHGDCLEALSANTDDDGHSSRVEAERDGDALRVQSPAGHERLHGCVMSFAYWNPGLRTRSSLLNPQTGRYESVRIEALPAATVEVRGQRVDALPYRISGAAQPLVVWYSLVGDWIGLDATLAGGRTLSYRLEQDPA